MHNGFCNYQLDCYFAHGIGEQKIYKIREKIYSMINSDTDLSDINLLTDRKLYEDMLVMTNVCQKCIKKKCQGGLNCRDGAMCYKYRLCKDDLIYGNCNKRCKYIHLSSKGLIPYNLRRYKTMAERGCGNLSEGILTEKFLLSRLTKNSDETSSDEFENNTDDIMEYLNDYIDSNSFDKSIFD